MGGSERNVKGYGQFCPVAMGAEVFATRWTPLLLRELMSGSTRFSDLRRGLPLMSSSLLSQRLQELCDAGLVEKKIAGDTAGPTYHLTPAGEALRPVVMGLGMWAHQWLKARIPEENLDPALLMWDIRRHFDASSFPAEKRIVVQFDMDGVKAGTRRYWLLIEGGEIDLCYKRPSDANDIEVHGHIRDLTEIWMGHLRYDRAIDDGRIEVIAERALRDLFRRSLLLSPFARQTGASTVGP